MRLRLFLLALSTIFIFTIVSHAQTKYPQFTGTWRAIDLRLFSNEGKILESQKKFRNWVLEAHPDGKLVSRMSDEDSLDFLRPNEVDLFSWKVDKVLGPQKFSISAVKNNYEATFLNKSGDSLLVTTFDVLKGIEKYYRFVRLSRNIPYENFPFGINGVWKVKKYINHQLDTFDLNEQWWFEVYPRTDTSGELVTTTKKGVAASAYFPDDNGLYVWKYHFRRNPGNGKYFLQVTTGTEYDDERKYQVRYKNHFVILERMCGTKDSCSQLFLQRISEVNIFSLEEARNVIAKYGNSLAAIRKGLNPPEKPVTDKQSDAFATLLGLIFGGVGNDGSGVDQPEKKCRHCNGGGSYWVGDTYVNPCPYCYGSGKE